MSQYLVAQSKVCVGEVDLDSLDPSFRKATLNMVLAQKACERVLAAVSDLDRNNLACLFATHFGEVESTLEFLSTYRETKIPRPILFQNSLHNSTLGFVSMQLQIRGPGATISADKYTVPAVAQTAESLLKSNPYILVCFVDCIPERLVGNYLRKHPFLESHIGHAKAFLLSKEKPDQFLRQLEKPLTDFSFVI